MSHERVSVLEQETSPKKPKNTTAKTSSLRGVQRYLPLILFATLPYAQTHKPPQNVDGGITPIQSYPSSVERVSVDENGADPNGQSYTVDISNDGRYVVYSSLADNLTPNDTNGHLDVFLFDRVTKITKRISVGQSGEQANLDSDLVNISGDGKRIVFRSWASNLVSPDTNLGNDIFLYKIEGNQIARVSSNPDGSAASGDNPSINYSGSLTTFESVIQPITMPANWGVFLKDLDSGSSTLVSIPNTGEQFNRSAWSRQGGHTLSDNGRYVVFTTDATNFEGDQNGWSDIFIRDTSLQQTYLISESNTGVQGNGSSSEAIISGNGQFILFNSVASNLIDGVTIHNPRRSVYGYDLATHSISLISQSESGVPANDDSVASSISADGRYVVFISSASNLVPDDYAAYKTYIYDRQTDKLRKVDIPCINQNVGPYGGASISADGRYLAFISASSLVPSDTNEIPDVFVYDLLGSETCYSNFLRPPIQSTSTVSILQGNINGAGSGRVNSFFDHQYPTYNSPPNITFPGLLRWDGQFFPNPTQMGLSWYDGHNGVDFQKKFNGEQAYASATGTTFGVVNNCILGNVSCGAGFGNQVWIDHGNGFATLYGHLKNVSTTNGQQILTLPTALGEIGSTGNSSGAHIHFGVYFDQNGNGIWTPQEVVDPYGWQGIGTDPWSPASSYLWLEDTSTSSFFGQEGGSMTSPSGRINVQIPSDMFDFSSFELWETGAETAGVGLLKSIGSAFQLRLTGGSQQELTSLLGATDSITLTVNYDDGQLSHLDEASLVVYKKDASGVWSALPTTVDTAGNVVTTHTDSEGTFDLEAPLLCEEDASEPNDNYNSASIVFVNAEPVIQTLDIQSDQDWYRANFISGQGYEIQIKNVTPGTKTLVQVFDIDGTSLITSVENLTTGISSTINLVSPRSGDFFIRITPAQNGETDCNSTYEFGVNSFANPSQYSVYLPSVTR